MRKVFDSDIYKMLDEASGYTKKISGILMGSKSVKIINNEMAESLNRIKRVYKDAIVLRIISEIESGNIILFITDDPNLRLPTCMPYFSYNKNGVKKVAINLSNYIEIKKTDIVEYSMDLKKLYCILIPAGYELLLYGDKTILSTEVSQSCAYLWSTMFNKILIKAIGLTSNMDRLNAFKYLAMKFFLIYYLNMSEKLAESSALSFMPGKMKNYVINNYESQVELNGINPFESFSSFFTSLMNPVYTGVRQIRGSKGYNADMNTSLYIKKFTQQYDFSAILSLASFSYFIFILFESYNWAYMANDKALEDVSRLDDKMTVKIFASLNQASLK